MSLFKTEELKTAQAALTTANDQLNVVKAEVETLRTQLATANTELETLKASNVSKASFDELQTKFNELSTKHAELEKNQKTAEQMALEITESQGVPPVAITPDNIISEGNSMKTDLKTLSSKGFIRQSELKAFLEKHSKEMNATAKP